MAEFVKLQSSDKVIFEVDKTLTKWIPAIRYNLENLEMEDVKQIPIIHLEKVAGFVLLKIILWIKHYQKKTLNSIEEGKANSEDDDYWEDWESKFFDEDKKILLELILAAKRLEIPGLLNTAMIYIPFLVDF